VAVSLAATAFAVAQPAEAHNNWNGGYRKWPWLAGDSVKLTTLPGECPHCPARQSSSSWKAIDAAMNYETVYAISPGKIDRWSSSGGAAGKYLRVRDDDGTYITYEHLSQALVTSGRVYAGMPIAVSGCTGNCSGPHLHFQRHDAASFSSKALPLDPISAHGSLQHAAYIGDNAGVGQYADGSGSNAIRNAYAAGGGYKTVGATADIGEAWSPCRNDSINGTWWRYRCAPASGIAGTVQTFRGPDERERAIMQAQGTKTAYVLHRGILAAYTEVYSGSDWVYWLGYPTSNRYVSSSRWWQDFQYGRIRFSQSRCEVDMYVDWGLHATYYFCD